jgi:TRAP-type C4-dicarboxylate transport system permease small subunit
VRGSRNLLLDRLHHACITFTRPIAFLGVIGMLIVSGVTMVDVLLRWLANSGVAALNEIVSMVFAVTITACLPHGVAEGINLKLDLLENWIVGRLAAWVDVVGMALVLLLLGLLTWRMEIYAASLASQGRITVILGWPQAPFMYAVTALLGIASLVQVIVLAKAIVHAVSYVPAPDRRE